MSHEGSFYSTSLMEEFDQFLGSRGLEAVLRDERARCSCEEYWMPSWLLATRPDVLLCPSAQWTLPAVVLLRGEEAGGAEAGGRERAVAELVARVRTHASDSYVFGYKTIRSAGRLIPPE